MAEKKVIFSTDFSSASDVALNYATSLAKSMGARLVIVHVEEPPLAYGGGELYYGIPEPDQAALKNMLTGLAPTDPAVPYEHRMLVGTPANEIVALAEQEKADLIVMGSHGRGGLARLILGSVAEVVVRKASCPVLIVKHPQARRQ
jgi:universal stress protein A